MGRREDHTTSSQPVPSVPRKPGLDAGAESGRGRSRDENVHLPLDPRTRFLVRRALRNLPARLGSRHVPGLQLLRRASRRRVVRATVLRDAVDSADKVRAEEAWVICQVCLTLVDANDREGLVERRIQRRRRRDRKEGRTRTPSEEAGLRRMQRDRLERLFWAPRTD